MARPERPIDAEAGPIQAFAVELRKLRATAGNPKYVTMARESGRSRTALTEAAGGDHLPTWNTVVGYVTACGGTPADWETHWEAARTAAKALEQRAVLVPSTGTTPSATATGAAAPLPNDAPARPRTTPPARWYHRRGVQVGAGALSAAVITAGITLAVVDPFSSATNPATGTGTYIEQAGSNGAPAYGNPFTISPEGGKIGPMNKVTVACRVYAPSLPSVIPDGYWYRISSQPWNGHFYAAASAFWNGDIPGHKPYTHNTDFKVPICPNPPKENG